MENPAKKLRNKIICVFGRRGSGKSFLVRNVVLERLHGRRIVYDPMKEYSGKGAIATSLPDFFDLLEAQERHIVFQSDKDSNFDEVCRVIYESQSNIWLVCDEIDMFCKATETPEWLLKITRYGRHKGIGLVVIARRPAAIPREITSQATYIVSFRQHEPRDIKYLSEFMPAEKLPEIGQYQYLMYCSDTGEITNKINF